MKSNENIIQTEAKPQSVSACMMVRDEEVNLERCLSSIKNFADEIIIVDTGSKDKTVEIAKSFGARIFFHPWEFDFSKHRNQSISYATKDWILIIDADEEMTFGQGGPEFLKRVLGQVSISKNNGHLAAAIVMKDIQSGMVALHQNTARFFKRGHIKYNGIVHNQPIMDSKASMIEESVCHIRHYGYDMTHSDMMTKKASRTLPLLLKWIENEPTNWHPHFYLVQIYAEQGNNEKTIEHGEIYLSHHDELENSGDQNFNKSIYYTMFAAYMRMGREQDANRWLTKGIKDCPDNIDLAFALVQFGVKTGNEQLIYLGTNQYIKLYDEIKTDPYKRQNLFMFTLNTESYAYCLYHMALSQFRVGIDSVYKLKNIVIAAQDNYRHGLLADLKSELMGLGMKDFASRHIQFDQKFLIKPLMEELKTKNPEIFN